MEECFLIVEEVSVTDKDNTPDPIDDFIKNFKEGWKKQDEKIKEDKENNSATQRVAEGTISGAVEAVSNPIRWLGSIFR